MKNHKVLFVLKSRESYGENKESSTQWKNSNHTGLRNSVKYVVDMLNKVLDIEAAYVIVTDNNDIDREVTKYRPTHVIIEALWVVPSKFEILTKLHPHIKWFIRLHSEIPFIAQEGIAMDWIFDYQKFKNVYVTSNSTRMTNSLSTLLQTDIPYTPNYYPLNNNTNHCYVWNYLKHFGLKKEINIGCFGAIRPLKNQLIQAVAAIRFANQKRYHLKFHINADRVETGGLPVLHNIKHLFENIEHELIEHNWLETENFVDVVKGMDIGMQVSFSETFNIVTADFVSQNIPVVVSPEIYWVNKAFQADPTDEFDIVLKLEEAWKGRLRNRQRLNLKGLIEYNESSEDSWQFFLQ